MTQEVFPFVLTFQAIHQWNLGKKIYYIVKDTIIINTEQKILLQSIFTETFCEILHSKLVRLSSSVY